MLIPVPIRYADFDALNHINHLSYLRYLEEARREFYRVAFNITRPEQYKFVLTDINCKYLKAIKDFKELTVSLEIKDISVKSFSIYYEIFDDIGIYFKGTTTHRYFVDNKSKDIPISIRNTLEKFKEPENQGRKK